MKSWIILTVVAVALTASGTVAMQMLAGDSSPRGPEFPAPSKPNGPAPKLVIDENLTYDFGVMAKQSLGKRPWVFRNEGAGVLQVRGSSATCSCTTSDLFEGEGPKKTGKQIEIPPGESKSVMISWETKNWDDFRQTVTLGSNDPDHPEILINIVGKVRPAIVTVPADPSLSFMGVGNDEPSLRRIALYSPDRPEMKITRIVSSNPALLVAEAKELVGEEATRYKVDKAFSIDVTLKPSPNLGDFNDEILVETDHPLQKSITIRVKGRITGPISVLPDKVTMHEASASDGGTEILTLWARGRTSVNFSVEKKPEALDVAIVPLPALNGMKGSRYKMTVKLVPGVAPGLIEGEITLKSDDPKASEIRVPVAILVKGTP